MEAADSSEKPKTAQHNTCAIMQVTTIHIYTELTNTTPGKSHATRNFNNVTDPHKQQQEILRYSHILVP